ncbi:MAG TPA: M20/M25/M40 family metallo-hydrolase [Bacillota bacterium]|jgi:tripeptide aminopeptidase|nr:M20/M25/M40 family metallo-hydrolase [Bacillota bacterium]
MDSIVDEFVELVKIDAESGSEAQMAAAVAGKLRGIGLEVEQDNAGNVIGRLSAHGSGCSCGDAIMLCAHLDRVPPGKGVNPVIRDGVVYSSGDTVLAADDIAGVTAILAGLRMAKASGKCLPPVEVVFTVSEERGLRGAKQLDYSRLASKTGYIFDAADPVGTVILSSPTHMGLEVQITGRAAHAAANPEDGISAIQVAAEAIVEFPFGRVDAQTTANVGIMSGGTATNIISEKAYFKAEVRSLDHQRALGLAEECAAKIRSIVTRRNARADIATTVDYCGYTIPKDAPVVERAVRALRTAGRDAVFQSTMGGSDGNVFNAHGIACVVLGIGSRDVHSTRESQPIGELVAAAELARDIILVG